MIHKFDSLRILKIILSRVNSNKEKNLGDCIYNEYNRQRSGLQKTFLKLLQINKNKINCTSGKMGTRLWGSCQNYKIQEGLHFTFRYPWNMGSMPTLQPSHRTPKCAPGNMNQNVLCSIIWNSKKWKQPRWINKWWHIHKNELELVVSIWMNLRTHNIEWKKKL